MNVYIVLPFLPKNESSAGDIALCGVADAFEKAEDIAKAHASLLKAGYLEWEECKGDPSHDELIVDMIQDKVVTYWVSRTPVMNYAIVEQEV